MKKYLSSDEKMDIFYKNNIQNIYPHIFKKVDHDLFFVDSCICTEKLNLTFSEIRETGIASFQIYSIKTLDKGLSITIKVEEKSFQTMRNIGAIMDVFDNRIITDEVCVKLFDSGISIIPYDESLIRRRHSINNIINEQ